MTKKLFIALSISVLAICGCSEKNIERQTPEDAKKYFVDAAQNTMKELDASNFTQAFEFIDSSIVAVYKSDAPDSLKKVMKKALKGLQKAKNDTTFRDYKGVSYSKYMDVKTQQEILFDLAAFNNLYNVDAKGHCTVADSKSLSLVLNNSKLGKIDFTMTKSSKETYVKVLLEENDTTYSGSRYLDKYGDIYEYDITDGFAAVKVPENIKLTASLNGKEIASIQLNAHLDIDDALLVNLKPDLDVISAAKGSMTLNVSIAGYSFGVEKAAIDTKNAVIKLSAMKGRKTLISAEGKVSGYQITEYKPSKAVTKVLAKYKLDAENVSVNINIHDEVQAEAKGSWDLINDFMDFNPTASTEAQVKSFFDEFNAGLETGIYFGDNTKQAEILLQYLKDGKDYKIIPCIQFTKDESIYTMEEYFTSTEFMHVAVDAMQLAQDFMNILPLPNKK